ncbi:MAG: hypothetical protein ABFR90_05480 [Planctomycetota bacterium]
MFELKTFYCPGCGTEIREKLHDCNDYVCTVCSKTFHVLIDEDSQRVGFVSVDEIALANPLGLPKGSIRAVTTILLSLSCWILILINSTAPGYLLGLLLTVTGYYFAFRKKDGTQKRFYDVATPLQSPLSLPSGSIRNVLIIGFFISAIVLLARKRFMEPAYIEFFLILTGFIAGHLLTKILPHVRHATVLNCLNHLKALIVLGAVVVFCIIMLAGHHERLWHVAIALSCIISFYFGSRS